SSNDRLPPLYSLSHSLRLFLAALFALAAVACLVQGLDYPAAHWCVVHLFGRTTPMPYWTAAVFMLALAIAFGYKGPLQFRIWDMLVIITVAGVLLGLFVVANRPTSPGQVPGITTLHTAPLAKNNR